MRYEKRDWYNGDVALLNDLFVANGCELLKTLATPKSPLQVKRASSDLHP